MTAFRRTTLATCLLIPFLSTAAVAQAPYHLGVHTDNGNDTMFAGVPGSLIFAVDSAGGDPAVAFTWALEFTFSGTNTMGPLTDVGPAPNIFFVWPPSMWGKAPRRRAWATNPDTAMIGIFYLYSPYWSGTGEQWRITFTPADTGTIWIDSAWLPPSNVMSVLSANETRHPLDWHPATVYVVRYCGTGDVNADRLLTSADIIYLVNYIFKGGPTPIPCIALGDNNCSGTITSADIIWMTTHIFKGGPPPCRSCDLVDQGVWTCP